MKLYTFDFHLTMTQTHDYVVRCARGNFQTCRKIAGLNNQRVITAGTKRLIESGKDRLAVVSNRRRLSMKYSRRAGDASAEHLADGLVTETNAEHRNSTREILDHFH